ncbi:hypothetical protein PaG_03375 [Moesziomyces aphidis]|uniref:Uncharacterized protein n=1 Tax=Moesziomyces aphidis TaxID=84754 RepID=W3VKX6_MOEAP|nr:hypothetical protein PaG_03375 [Moesziomyces aphidis]
MQNSYAQLISQLSNTQVGAGRESSPDQRYYEGGNRYYQSPEYHDSLTQRTDSSKDTPPTASLASGRSSSDANHDDLRTPPEPSYDAFEPSLESAHYHPSPAHQEHRAPLYAQPDLPYASSSSALPLASQTAPNAGAHAPQLGSPFQPSQRQPQQPTRSLQRQELQQVLSRYDISDDSALEMLSDDFEAQRRAAGKARMMPGQHAESNNATAVSSPAQSAVGHGRRGSSNVTVLDASKPFTRLGTQDIAFSAANLPERRLTADDCVDIIVSRHPTLCDAPLREFGEDGQPLPPTKKQETSDEERAARKQALGVKFCAKQRLSLIKAMILMESRSASWKRVGPFNAANTNTNTAMGVDPMDATGATSHGEQGVGRLPPMPSPWSIEIRHEQLDVAQIKGKSKKSVELASLRTNALCTKCEGSKLGACLTCKAEQADECFWCSGTGREKTRAQAWCRRCQGAGVLKCNTCHGSLKSDCRSCEGTGMGEYGFFVDVTVKRVEMPAVPLATLFPQLESASASFQPSYDEVRAAAKLALWDSITKLTEARHHAVATKGGKSKSKDMVPVMAACVWENSTSHVVSVDVPLTAKFKKGASPALRPEGLQRKIPTQRRFFTVPTDADLCSVELSEEEVKKIVHDSIGDHAISGRGPSPATPPDSRGSSGYALGSPYGSTTPSPPMSLSGSSSASLATPDEGAGMSGYSTPSRVPSPRSDLPPAKPAAKEFVHRPSPLSQLAATTPAASTFSVQTDAARLDSNYSNGSPRSSPEQSPEGRSGQKLRRPSAGQILSKKLSSNILNKLSAHRGSV